MKDPVILPSSRIIVDRPVIQRHLLSDNVCVRTMFDGHFIISIYGFQLIQLFVLQTDPFNRSHLTADMLIPDTQLKAQIDEFIRSRELKPHGEDVSMQTTKRTIQTTDGTPLID